jgi:hypothetical protein
MLRVLSVCDQDKIWATHISCVTFTIPVVWREPKEHSIDCYFCLTNIGRITSKSKHTMKRMIAVKYPHFPSAVKPVPHGEELPTLCDKK